MYLNRGFLMMPGKWIVASLISCSYHGEFKLRHCYSFFFFSLKNFILVSKSPSFPKRCISTLYAAALWYTYSFTFYDCNSGGCFHCITRWIWYNGGTTRNHHMVCDFSHFKIVISKRLNSFKASSFGQNYLWLYTKIYKFSESRYLIFKSTFG